MPNPRATDPILFIAEQNGWAWMAEGPDGQTTASRDVLKRDGFEETAAATLGVKIADLPPKPWANQQLDCPNGEAYLLMGNWGRLVLLKTPTVNTTHALAMSATHELANALSAICGWAQLGLHEPSKTRDALLTVETAAASAQRVARDVLEIHSPRPRQPCDAAEVCRDVAKLLLPVALRRNVSVTTDADVKAWTSAHRSAVLRVVWNLALNAIQILPPGGKVEIRCRKRLDDVEIIVVDDGPGIAPENHDRLFDVSFSKRPGGTGLGLATVQQALLSVDGEITIESTLGVGARFEVRVPRATEDHSRRSGIVLSELPRRVLVVEDDQGVRELIETTLSLRGIEVVAVVDVASARKETGPFDVALADLTLPDGRGDTLLAKLKLLGVAKRTVVTSGQVDPGTLAGPPDAWLAKPFDIHDLLMVLRKPPLEESDSDRVAG